MLEAWSWLADMFGNRFLDQFGDVPPPAWDAALQRLELSQIRRALARLARDDIEHPPTLSEFLAAARSFAPGRYCGVPENREQRKARLDVVRATPEQRARALANIRATLARAT